MNNNFKQKKQHDKNVGKQKLLFFLLFTVIFWVPFAVSAQLSTLTEKISVRQNQTTALKIIELLDQQSKFQFTYAQEQLVNVKIPVFKAEDIKLGKVLALLQKQYGLQFAIRDGNISVKPGPRPEHEQEQASSQKKTGRVTGKIIDKENGQPVTGATVRIGNAGTTTDMNGSFSVTLPKGNYTAVISFVGYGTKEITEVKVKENEIFELNAALERKKGQLAAVVVKSSARKESINALYARQKNNAAITDGISAEQIRTTPDNNAAQVLKRVSGLTIQDEKFVTVRGLSERYNTVIMNGASMPSTEPNRRNFAFDIIPSGLIDNIVIHKTATPDLSSEFAGGMVLVNTKDIPAENYTSLSAGTGINTNTVGKPMLGTKRGKHEYLGFDDGTKGWWQKKSWSFPKYAELLRGGSWDAIYAMGLQVPNNWGILHYNYSPVQNYQLSVGRKLILKKGGNIGVTLGTVYRHDEVREVEERRTATGDQYEYEGDNYVFRTSLGAVLNIAYQQGGHKVVLKNLYNRLFINETSDYYGFMKGFGSDEPQRNYLSLTTINDLWHRRLEGEHSIGNKGIKFDWGGDWISMIRDQPDTRNSIGTQKYGRTDYYEYLGMADKIGFLSRGMAIFNSRLKETKYNWSGNVNIPVKIAGRQHRIKAGYTGTFREADFESFALSGLMHNINEDQRADDYVAKTLGLPDYKLLAPELMQGGYNYYGKADIGGNDYDGFQRLHAGYLMLDAQLLRKLRLIGGIRIENNTMYVNGEFYKRGIRYKDYTYQKTDWLPSANLIYSLNSSMNLRLAASQTLSRPDFRERAAFVYYEFKTRNEYSGALGLTDARITNVDLRYEFYPGPGEVLSLSLFHKYFDSPIELIAAQGSGNLRYFYFNLKSSVSTGLEMDFRKSLAFINPASKILNNIYLSGNTTWMKANVKYDGDALLREANEITNGGEQGIPANERKRPVQGLSTNIYNAGIGYTGKPVGIQVNYNRFGKRIVNGGLYPFQDEYENPRDVIDLQLNTTLLKNKLILRFNIGDILQQPHIIYNNFSNNSPMNSADKMLDNPNHDPKGTSYNPDLDFTRYKSKRGINLSLSATYIF